MTWLNTSVHSGFARSASEAMFPRLFPDAGWWCPSLNPAMGGTRLWDLSGRQNWGTLTNMANDDWVVNGGKGALDFDGSNDFVGLGTGLNSSIISGFAVSAWIRLTSNPSDSGIVANFDGNNGTLASRIGFSCRAIASGSGVMLRLLLNNGSATSIGRDTGDLNLASKWVNAIFSWDGTFSASGISIYVDGSRSDTQSLSGGTFTAFPASAREITIGRVQFATSTPSFPGQSDDIRIYRRPLTATEVRQLYQIGRGNMPLRRRRRYTEQAAGGFKGYWARNNSRLIGAGNVSS